MERKTVSAKYSTYSTFVVPEGIDLENKDQVEDWWVGRDRLYINLKDGTLLTIEPYIRACDDTDYSYAEEVLLTKQPVGEEYTEKEYVTIEKK